MVVPVIQPSVNFSYATARKCSPGSTIKPLLVYALALASGWSINRTSQINQSTITAVPQLTTVVLGLRDMPMYQALSTPTISQQFTSLIKSVYKKGSVTVKIPVLTLTMFQKDTGISLGGGVTASPLQMAPGIGDLW